MRFLLFSILSVVALAAAAFAQGPVVPSNYLLNPTDRLLIKVFQEDDLTTDARISNDGTVVIPLIGSVHLAGNSVNDAVQIIRQKLKKGYLVNPQVNVTVTEFARRVFTIIGEVQKGGTYDFPDQGNLDLLQAIGMAGGYSKIANPGKVIVKRHVDGKEMVYKLNAKKQAGDDSTAAFQILPGDTITVGESFL